MNIVDKIRHFNRYYASVLGKIDQEIYHQPYTLTESRILTEINLRNGCSATEIRENLGIDRGYLSRIIQRFEDEKIVIKKRFEDDKRQYALYLTDHGQKILHTLIEHANHEIGKMLQTMSDHEQAKLVASMEAIEAILTKKPLTNAKLSIRSFQPGDVGYVASLHGALYAKSYGFGSIFEYDVMKGLTEFIEKPDRGGLWIAEVNGEPVGSIAITKSSEKVAQLRWFIIDEKYQGLGIGKKLMNTAIVFCKEQGYQHVFLWTVSILKTARHLYQSYNFTLTEKKENNSWTGTNLTEERWDLILSEDES
ncbi:bifunctional helix-turn-helix transcriptional regulator/GNAT family N-acetyltransferase [Halalkalibacterium ligniniphilum]|uniref:bifunctional helix-turn-helix transcriptional regulator/GNAT family N-acetyltransferase n=1 Tax=Halalkalibacterium ligniniphilum TaxID=1134413 RepID=UPI000553BC8C|nr:helix-turn-helix domain-containing GNAT family N-acetyltransferase [Halalkalibacterium ligniniphilum]